VDLQQYIEKQDPDFNQMIAFQSLLSRSAPGEDVVSFPSIINDELLEEFFEELELDVQKKDYNQFKIFYVPEVDCPCILYSGKLDLDKLNRSRGIKYTQRFYARAAGFHHESSEKCKNPRFIYIKSLDGDLDRINAVLFHEIVHFFNSFDLDYEEDELNYLFSNLIDEMCAYTYANKVFPTIQQFHYLKEDDNEIKHPTFLNNKKDFNDFANIYFAFRKAALRNDGSLELLIEKALERPNPNHFLEAVYDSGFNFDLELEKDMDILMNLNNSSFDPGIHSTELIENHHLIIAERLMIWSLEKLVGEDKLFNSHKHKDTFFSILKTLGALHQVELDYVSEDVSLHVVQRQENLVKNKILPLIKGELHEYAELAWQTYRSKEQINPYSIEHLKVQEGFLETCITLYEDPSTPISTKKIINNYLELELEIKKVSKSNTEKIPVQLANKKAQLDKIIFEFTNVKEDIDISEVFRGFDKIFT
jgi:hypothetical protein